MAITKDMAMKELARRELARRASSNGQAGDSENPNYNPKDLGFAGLPGLGFGRGSTAVKNGAKSEDVPGVMADAASGFYGDSPERIAERPIHVSVSGLFGIASDAEKKKLPFPRPVTDEGKKLGEEVKKFGEVAGTLNLLSDIPGLYKDARGFVDYVSKKKPGDFYKKAEDLLVQILKPRVSELNNASARGYESPEALKRTLPYVKPSKDYEQLAGTLRGAKNKTAKARNEIIRKDNFDLDNSFLEPLKGHIVELSKRPQTEDVKAELDTAMGVYNDYKEWAGKGKSRAQAQIEKTKLQKETEPLLKKVSKGEAIDRNPDIVKSKDRVRSGLKDAVHGGDAEAIRLDQDYGALKQTSAMANNQMNLARKAPEPGLVEKTINKVPIVKQVFQAITRNKPYSVQMAVDALNAEPSLMSQTKKIADLYERAKSLEGRQRVNIPKYTPRIEFDTQAEDEVQKIIESAYAPKRLTGPNQPKQITASDKYGGGFERVPEDDAYSRIKDFAFKYFKPSKPDIEIPFVGEQKKAPNVGIKEKVQTIANAYQAALRRIGKK